MASTPKQKVVIVGAGPVGSLAALYAASRGDDVELYELRGGTYIYQFLFVSAVSETNLSIQSFKECLIPVLLYAVFDRVLFFSVHRHLRASADRQIISVSVCVLCNFFGLNTDARICFLTRSS
jgi:2-polyprenyl-6-methoxyphenol hydroxylase-like FAD-dependent oxidoreductase